MFEDLRARGLSELPSVAPASYYQLVLASDSPGSAPVGLTSREYAQLVVETHQLGRCESVWRCRTATQRQGGARGSPTRHQEAWGGGRPRAPCHGIPKNRGSVARRLQHSTTSH